MIEGCGHATSPCFVHDAASPHACSLERLISHPPTHMRQDLHAAREAMSASTSMSTPPSRATTTSVGVSLAVDEPEDSDSGHTGVLSRASSTPEGEETAAESGVAYTAGVQSRGGSTDVHAEMLKTRAEEIMERILSLASFCEDSGAADEIEASVNRTRVPACAEVGHRAASLRRIDCGTRL